MSGSENVNHVWKEHIQVNLVRLCSCQQFEAPLIPCRTSVIEVVWQSPLLLLQPVTHDKPQLTSHRGGFYSTIYV